MKRYLFLFVILAALLLQGCATLDFIFKGSVKDPKGQVYSWQVSDNADTKSAEVAIDIQEKTYTCSVSYAANASEPFSITFDFSAYEITGKIGVTYKKVSTWCSVEQASDIESVILEGTN